jgi:hypothetical protein
LQKTGVRSKSKIFFKKLFRISVKALPLHTLLERGYFPDQKGAFLEDKSIVFGCPWRKTIGQYSSVGRAADL